MVRKGIEIKRIEVKVKQNFLVPDTLLEIEKVKSASEAATTAVFVVKKFGFCEVEAP